MDKNELARKMLEWGQKSEELARLTAEIETAVLELGETQTVGDVRATYSKGRKRYDYREAAEGHPMVSDATISLFTKTPEPVTDWRAICEHAGIEDVPFVQGEPSVKVKVVA